MSNARRKPTVTVPADEYMAAVNDDMGWCVDCQEFTRDMCEPDAREYDCPDCGGSTVYGAEEALVQDMIEVLDFVQGGTPDA